MLRLRRHHLGYACLLAALIFMGGAFGYRTALQNTHSEASANLALAADRLTLQLDRFRSLPSVLSKDPAILEALVADDEASIAHLRRVADTTGAVEIFLITSDGRLLGNDVGDVLDLSLARSGLAWRVG